LVDASKLGGVRHPQQPSGEGGLRAQYPNDVVGARIGRLKRALNAQYGLWKRRQLEPLVTKILRKPLDEAEADGMSRS
jgi:hypothetical protein